MCVSCFCALLLRHQDATQIVGGSGNTGGQILFVVLVDVEDGQTTLCSFDYAQDKLLDAVAVAIINKGGATADSRYLIFYVPGKGLTAPGSHITIGIIGVVR